MTTEELQNSSSAKGENGDASGSKKAPKPKAKNPARAGAESGPKYHLIPGLTEPEERTVLMTNDAAAAVTKILKGAAEGMTASDALTAATIRAMALGGLKLPPRPQQKEEKLTMPRPLWSFQEALAKDSGRTLAEVQEALLKAYLDKPKGK